MRTIIIILLTTTSVAAHVANSGFIYPQGCCGDKDCREIDSSMVKETKDGYRVLYTDEVISHSDERIKFSPDGVYHWCSINGLDTSRTVCLYVPLKGY